MTKTYSKEDKVEKTVEISEDGKTAIVHSVKVVEHEKVVTKHVFVSKDKTEWNFIKKDKIDWNLIPKDVVVLKVVEKKKEIEVPELNTQALQQAVRRVVVDIIEGLNLGDYIKDIIKQQMKDVKVANLVPFDFPYPELKPYDFEYPKLKPFDKAVPVIVEGETIPKYNFIKKDKIDWNFIKRDKVITREVEEKV